VAATPRRKPRRENRSVSWEMGVVEVMRWLSFGKWARSTIPPR
jgi:hypothetical protein